MLTLAELWLPILLSAVFVFIASSIFHMAIPIHKGDWKKLPGEEKVLAEMRNQSVRPGAYMFPSCESYKDMCNEEMTEKYKQGPVGHVTVLPNGPPSMGKALVLWFIYTLVIGLFVGYTGILGGLDRGAAYSAVFRFTGTVALLAYAVTALPDAIWKGQPWSVTGKFIFDGLIYGLVTAGTFGWLWPEVV